MVTMWITKNTWMLMVIQVLKTLTWRWLWRRFFIHSLFMDLNKILIWNCRGAASPDHFRNRKQFVNIHHPEIFAVIETLCNSICTQSTFCRLGYGGFVFSENRGFAGGIAVWLEV